MAQRVITCPSCHGDVAVPIDYFRRLIPCPACGTSVQRITSGAANAHPPSVQPHTLERASTPEYPGYANYTGLGASGGFSVATGTPRRSKLRSLKVAAVVLACVASCAAAVAAFVWTFQQFSQHADSLTDAPRDAGTVASIEAMRWQRYSSAEGAFEAEFPGEVTHSRVSVDGHFTEADMQIAQWSSQNFIFEVQYGDVRPTISGFVSFNAPKAMQETCAKNNLKLISSAHFVQDGDEGHEFSARAEDGTTIHQATFWVLRRIYAIRVQSAPGINDTQRLFKRMREGFKRTGLLFNFSTGALGKHFLGQEFQKDIPIPADPAWVIVSEPPLRPGLRARLHEVDNECFMRVWGAENELGTRNYILRLVDSYGRQTGPIPLTIETTPLPLSLGKVVFVGGSDPKGGWSDEESHSERKATVVGVPFSGEIGFVPDGCDPDTVRDIRYEIKPKELLSSFKVEKTERGGCAIRGTPTELRTWKLDVTLHVQPARTELTVLHHAEFVIDVIPVPADWIPSPLGECIVEANKPGKTNRSFQAVVTFISKARLGPRKTEWPVNGIEWEWDDKQLPPGLRGFLVQGGNWKNESVFFRGMPRSSGKFEVNLKCTVRFPYIEPFVQTVKLTIDIQP